MCGMTTQTEVELLNSWVARVDRAAPHEAAPVQQIDREAVKLPGTGKPKPSRAERRHAEREAEHQASVNAWCGPRPLLPSEAEKLRGYGHGDGF